MFASVALTARTWPAPPAPEINSAQIGFPMLLQLEGVVTRPAPGVSVACVSVQLPDQKSVTWNV